jgi:hypothetical protein
MQSYTGDETEHRLALTFDDIPLCKRKGMSLDVGASRYSTSMQKYNWLTPTIRASYGDALPCHINFNTGDLLKVNQLTLPF